MKIRRYLPCNSVVRKKGQRANRLDLVATARSMLPFQAHISGGKKKERSHYNWNTKHSDTQLAIGPLKTTAENYDKLSTKAQTTGNEDLTWHYTSFLQSLISIELHLKFFWNS